MSDKETHDALMTEMLGENDRLKKLANQRGARLQILWEHMRLVDRHNFILWAHPEAARWFDSDGVPCEK